jgi:hypothetical protein
VLEEHHQKCSPPMFPPPLAKCDAAGHQHPTHMKNWCRHSSPQPKHLYTITTLRSQLLWLSPPLSMPWKSIFRHVLWHRQESKASWHALMKPHWPKWRDRFWSRYLVTPYANMRNHWEEDQKSTTAR